MAAFEEVREVFQSRAVVPQHRCEPIEGGEFAFSVGEGTDAVFFHIREGSGGETGDFIIADSGDFEDGVEIRVHGL